MITEYRIEAQPVNVNEYLYYPQYKTTRKFFWWNISSGWSYFWYRVGIDHNHCHCFANELEADKFILTKKHERTPVIYKEVE